MPRIAKKKEAAHWFHSKSPAAQKAYIAAHPNSIYAKKGATKAKISKTAETRGAGLRAAREARRASTETVAPKNRVNRVRKAALPAHENWDGWDPEPTATSKGARKGLIKKSSGSGAAPKVRKGIRR